jgi:hypothetical protein
MMTGGGARFRPFRLSAEASAILGVGSLKEEAGALGSTPAL